MTKEQKLFNANFGMTTVGKKERSEIEVINCDYCEGSGLDIFYKTHPCPFCLGSLIAIKQKSRVTNDFIVVHHTDKDADEKLAKMVF